ncbi:putative entry exclusion protein TrbK-alt [Paracoccus versutus]|uniref:Conjugative transfer region protein TrbK n=1 Tax=Paracoccus versutus TaxID=34007 RepID=A0A3D9XF93_PARVE|nr:putative entry exclusion protein TrbK-alt [Paracoccus versutus]REF66752.1 conjugative transfer region protein TrbK [Paracoccus versutus]REF73255.1 conjugative transfer region protein TrbK [Paracoccus versutus]WGR54714.1 conjugal transfer protein TrbK [Paracoccus versutus]
MEGKVLARIAAIVFVAVAITATVIEMTREDVSTAPAPSAPSLQPPTDPLREGQRRCQRLGEAAANDAECLHIWAETRDRFLGRTPAPATPAPIGGR